MQRTKRDMKTEGYIAYKTWLTFFFFRCKNYPKINYDSNYKIETLKIFASSFQNIEAVPSLFTFIYIWK